MHHILKSAIIVLGGLCITACASTQVMDEPAAKNTEAKQAATTPTMDHSKMTIGNGVHNYIEIAQVKRTENKFTYKIVALDADGFLVMHPFKDGKPVQTVYVGATFLKKGVHTDVSIDLDYVPQTGEQFIAMLHYDKNTDGIFDFNDGVTVPDAPVFEGHNLVALRMKAPANTMKSLAHITNEMIRTSYQHHAAMAAMSLITSNTDRDHQTKRLKFLAHQWIVEVEKPTKTPKTARALLADEFALHFTSGKIDTYEDLATWFNLTAASVEAARHELHNFHYVKTGEGQFDVHMEMVWQGISKDGKRMTAHTKHHWIVIDDVANNPHAKIKVMHVEIIEPFMVVGES